VEEKEIKRKEKELKSAVTLPAVAEAYKIKTIAEGMKAKEIAAALGESVMIKCIGESEAACKEAIGKAEAKRMNAKAEALQKYGESALIAMVVENLAQTAYGVCKPLNKTNDIVLINGEEKKANLNGLFAGNISSLPTLNLLEGKEGKKEARTGQDMLPPHQSRFPSK
jgi:flotillin